MGRFAETIRRIKTIYNTDERTIGERMLFGGTALLSLMFTIMFFGPLDIYLSNSSEFSVDLYHMFMSLSALFIVVYILTLMPMMLLKGFLLDKVVSFVVIIALEF